MITSDDLQVANRIGPKGTERQTDRQKFLTFNIVITTDKVRLKLQRY